MTDILFLIPQLAYFFLPVAAANMAPVLFQHVTPFLAVPVDGGKSWKGKRILGDHKTWRGFIFGTLLGGVVFLLQLLLLAIFPDTRSWWAFESSAFPFYFGFLFGFSALFGDALKSFFKRRAGVPPGQRWFPFDQIDFLLTSTFLATLFVDVTAMMWFFILFFGIILHVGINRIGYWLHLEHTKW